jgi:putative serine protease PepD
MNEHWTVSASRTTPAEEPVIAPTAAEPAPPARGSRLLVPVLLASILSAGLAAGATAILVQGEGGGTTTIVQEAAGGAVADPDPAGDSVQPALGDGALTAGQIFDRYESGIVRVQHAEGLGTGFVFDDEGRILTNAHVVNGADEVSVAFSDGRIVEAEVIGIDNATDVAVLRVDLPADELTVVPLGDSASADVGDPVVAIGNPLGHDNTVTAGIISAVARSIQAPNGFSINGTIQTDAAINRGNSGGPLFDTGGRVIGINTQIDPGQSNGNIGIGFAVPVDLVERVAGDLIATGQAQHAWLGVSLVPITPDIADEMRAPVEAGVMVARVTDGSPAAGAGLRGATDEVQVEGMSLATGGDVITEIDGKAIATVEDLQAAISAKRPGDEIELRVIRADGGEETIVVELGNQPQAAVVG